LLDDEEPNWREIAAECAKHLGKLRGDREREFVQDMVRWTMCGRQLTEPQMKWLSSIYVRVRQ
jgi:hypothetical protein